MLLVQPSVHSSNYCSIYLLLNQLGLPAESLILNKDHIYWTQSNDIVIYYVSRNDRDDLLTLPLPSNNMIILVTTPGLQPFPKNWLHSNMYNL